MIYDLCFKIILFSGIMALVGSLYDLVWLGYLYGKKYIKDSFFLLAIVANIIAFGLIIVVYGLELLRGKFAVYLLYLVVIVTKGALYRHIISKPYSSRDYLRPIFCPFIASVITAFILLQLPYFNPIICYLF